MVGKIVNTAQNGSVYVYPSKDTGSEPMGILAQDGEIGMFPSESDANWTTVYFSGQKAYVETKYIEQTSKKVKDKKVTYKVTDISNLRVANIVKDEIKMKWNAGKNNVEYSCSIYMMEGNKKKVLWSDKHYKKNSFLIKREYIEKADTLYITVQATDKNGKKGKELSNVVYTPRQAGKLEEKSMVVGQTRIEAFFGESVQYSTDKNFKNAVTLEKFSSEEGRYEWILNINNLKKNTTYYIRCRSKQMIKTDAGTKWISGKWSESTKVTTKK